MKNNKLKVVCLVICMILSISMFAGCGGEEPAPEPDPVPQVAVLDSFTLTWMGDSKTYSVDSGKLTIDEAGRVATIVKTYDTINCEYNADNALTKAYITDGAFETWTYEGKVPVTDIFDSNGGFRSNRDTTIETTLNEDGTIAELVENIKFTDSEDGSVSYGTNKYVYTYDANGRITSVDYYSDGEKDHTTNLQYDENGNILSYANVGADSGSVYLRIDFGYVMVDETSVTLTETDPFTTVYNWESLLGEFIL